MMATQELVVPRSIPITLLIYFDPFQLGDVLGLIEDPFRHPRPGSWEHGRVSPAARQRVYMVVLLLLQPSFDAGFRLFTASICRLRRRNRKNGDQSRR